MDRALYEIIAEAMVDGQLPWDFRLPREQKGGMAFADGAMDGIMLYHMEPGGELTGEKKALIASAIDTISKGSFYEAEEIVWKIAEEIGALHACDALRQYIHENAERLNLGELFHFAVSLVTQSPNRSVVKIGLAIASVFKPDEEVSNYIRTLGLSDEFTLYVAVAMSSWDDTNGEWFALAQKVGGWGRIHLVARLRPETEEIRRWLLREGVHNSVLPAYSALQCWVKADVPAVLAGDMCREDFEGVRDIIDGLLDEGPVRGMSVVEDNQRHVLAFLEKAKGMALDEEDQSVIANIRGYFEDSPEIVAACNALLN